MGKCWWPQNADGALRMALVPLNIAGLGGPKAIFLDAAVDPGNMGSTRNSVILCTAFSAAAAIRGETIGVMRGLGRNTF